MRVRACVCVRAVPCCTVASPYRSVCRSVGRAAGRLMQFDEGCRCPGLEQSFNEQRYTVTCTRADVAVLRLTEQMTSSQTTAERSSCGMTFHIGLHAVAELTWLDYKQGRSIDVCDRRRLVQLESRLGGSLPVAVFSQAKPSQPACKFSTPQSFRN